MTDKAYYEKGFDIVSARERFFGKREMCERYVIRFLEDPNYEEMIKAIREKDTEQAFHYAHTLKGVCANCNYPDTYRFYQSIPVFRLLHSLQPHAALRQILLFFYILTDSLHLYL